MYALYGHDVMLDALCMLILHALHACGIMKTNPCNYLEQLHLTGTVLEVFNLVQNHADTIPKQCNVVNSMHK